MEAFQPLNFRRSLFPHQLKNISTMEELEQKQRVKLDDRTYIKTRLGILADKTGYGKTASVIGLLVRDKLPWDLSLKYRTKQLGQFSKNNLIIVKKKQFYQKINCNLILVPDSISFQWEEELSYTDLKYLIVSQVSRLKKSLENVDVVVVTPKLFNIFIAKYRNLAWKRFVFDEPGNVRVPSMHEVIAGFYWFMTATVGRIYQFHNKCSTSFMFSFLTGYEYDWWLINKLTIRNSDELLEISFSSPRVDHKEYYASNKTFTIVKNYASEMITQMISAGDITGALEALGGQPTDNLFELLKMTKKNKVLLLKEKITKISDGKHPQTVKKYLQTIRKLEKQTQEIQTQAQAVFDSDCIICYEPLKNPVMEPACEKLFCGTCLLTWLKLSDSCPVCRAAIDTGNIYYVETEKVERRSVCQDKLEVLLDILGTSPEGRFIIFSSFDQSFKNIVATLQTKNISFIEAKGSGKTIEANLKRFKAGEVNVLLLNSNHNGAGLNLQEATDVILYHKMETNTEVQVVGRANRIGRREPLTVHHLLYK